MKAFHEVRNYKSDFMVWHNSYRDISFLAHWHREIELIFIRSGSVKIHVTSFTINAKEGDLIVCDSGDIHYSDTRSEGSCLDFVLFDTSIISTHYQYNYFENPHIKKEELAVWGLTSEFTRLLNLLDEELSSRDNFYQDVVESELRGFWFRLLRNMPTQSAQTLMQNRRLSMLSDFQNLLSFMEDHYEDNITLEDAAEMMNFSPSHFSKMFKQLIGINFVKYLNIIRISQSAERLMTTDNKITDISFICGFNNVRTFNRVFKEVTGHTPSEYVSMPESKSYNFTYYRSSADILSLPEELPTTVVKRESSCSAV